MNKEELIGKLQMVYVGDKNALNELIGYYDGLKECIEIVQQENKQLKDNWNKLKEWVKEGKKISSVQDNRIGYNFTTFILDKIQEIEGGMNI